jgi:hypothetical protein
VSAGEKKSRQVAIDIPWRDTYYVVPLNPLKLAKALLRRWFRQKQQDPPGYPFADKFAPLKPRRKDRSGAVVAEIDE